MLIGLCAEKGVGGELLGGPLTLAPSENKAYQLLSYSSWKEPGEALESSLPLDVWLYIFSFLEGENLFQTQRVSSFFYDLSVESSREAPRLLILKGSGKFSEVQEKGLLSWAHSLDFRDYNFSLDEEPLWIEALKGRKLALLRVKVSLFSQSYEDGFLSEGSFSSLLKNLKALKHLDWESSLMLPDVYNTDIFPYLGKVRRLSYRKSTRLLSEEMPKSSGLLDHLNFPNLERVSLLEVKSLFWMDFLELIKFKNLNFLMRWVNFWVDLFKRGKTPPSRFDPEKLKVIDLSLSVSSDYRSYKDKIFQDFSFFQMLPNLKIFVLRNVSEKKYGKFVFKNLSPLFPHFEVQKLNLKKKRIFFARTQKNKRYLLRH